MDTRPALTQTGALKTLAASVAKATEMGLPIMIDGHCLGGVGVGTGSGAEDIVVAGAALAAHGAEQPLWPRRRAAVRPRREDT